MTDISSHRNSEPRGVLMNILRYDKFGDLKITEFEASWVSSLSNLGFPLGALLSSLFIDLLGKKWAAVFGQATTYCLGYSFITFAVNVQCIYVGRFLCGICQVMKDIYSKVYSLS